MASKKRKASGRAENNSLKPSDKSESKIAMTTYEDVADSEDEFHINRDKVLLEDGPEAKRQRKWQDEGLFPSPSVLEIADQCLKMPFWNNRTRKS